MSMDGWACTAQHLEWRYAWTGIAALPVAWSELNMDIAREGKGERLQRAYTFSQGTHTQQRAVSTDLQAVTDQQ